MDSLLLFHTISTELIVIKLGPYIADQNNIQGTFYSDIPT